MHMASGSPGGRKVRDQLVRPWSPCMYPWPRVRNAIALGSVGINTYSVRDTCTCIKLNQISIDKLINDVDHNVDIVRVTPLLNSCSQNMNS